MRVAALGKTGVISGLLKGMGAMSPDERREQGPMINGLRDRVAVRHRRPARPSWKPPNWTPACCPSAST